MKSTQLYDFTLSANGSQVILADANFYKVLTSTGDLQITRDGGSTVKPMRAGRGEREVPFQRLTIRDISGATNSGTIVVGDSNFIDDTIILSSAINVRPEVQSGFFSSVATLAANTPDTIIAPGSNVNGAILLSAGFSVFNTTSYAAAGFISKASAPTAITDGSPLLVAGNVAINTALFTSTAQLAKEQYIAAGQGLYFITSVASVAGDGANTRGCRYKLL